MTPAMKRLIDLADAARMRLTSGNSTAPDALFYELSDAIFEVRAELSRTPQQQHEDRIEELDLQWNR